MCGCVYTCDYTCRASNTRAYRTKLTVNVNNFFIKAELPCWLVGIFAWKLLRFVIQMLCVQSSSSRFMLHLSYSLFSFAFRSNEERGQHIFM